MFQRMRILFLHPNFPAQFRHLASRFGKDGHEVRFLCQTHHDNMLAGVERLCLKGELGQGALNSATSSQLERSQQLADQYRRGMDNLRQQGWQPDLVVSHSGWGCGMHVKTIWPRCRQIAYVEWWFDPDSALLHHDPGNRELGLTPDSASKVWKRNQTTALELVAADHVVAPTRWQRQQLPASLQERCEVIFDGIDLNTFQPDRGKRTATPLLTYGTRGMEPMRCFPQFIRELPALLRADRTLQVEIAGADESFYGGTKPAEGSWGRWARNQLDQQGWAGRVTWLGRLPLNDYISWLQRSWVHVYLTHPFVVSWSLLEALACGCPLVASDVAPVREFCGPGRGTLVDHRSPGFLLPAVNTALQTTHRTPQPLPPELKQRLSMTHCLLRWKAVAGVDLATTD